MLYEEFLIGTEQPDNDWTYAEYKRIEQIYNNDNSLEKSDAYKMYQEPNELIRSLLDKISDYKAEMICARAENRALQRTIESKDEAINELTESIEIVARAVERLNRAATSR